VISSVVSGLDRKCCLVVIYFAGVVVEAGAFEVLEALVDFFAFFLEVFFLLLVAGAAGVAVAAGADDVAGGVVPCAKATAPKAVITSAATKCFIASSFVES